MTGRVEAERAIAGAVRQIVADYALGTESLHANWRCGYPDTYGPCNCVDEFVADAVKVLADLMAEKQAEALGDAADAWQQGQWSDALSGTQRPSQVQARIATAQAVTDWLRSRAEAHERPPVDIPDPKDTRDE